MRPRSENPPRDLTALRLSALLAVCALSACGGGGQRPTASYTTPDYRAPGPPSDPWGPYITEASGRFSVPPSWIRAVMRQESGGHEYLHGQPITSDAGAAGLMQVMPSTYAELADRFHLGPDPYEPHDNIMAGTGYIRDLFDRYGSPTFLAAYNAGPHRVDDYLAGRGALPNETVNYVASIAPNLAGDRPLTGALAAYADAGPIPAAQAPVPRAFARAPSAQCWQDPDAAYDPDAPCRAAPPVVVAAARAPRVTAASYAAECWHDPDAAYDPDAPCRPRPKPALVLPPPQTPPPPVQVAARTESPDWHRLLAVAPAASAQAYTARATPRYLVPATAAAALRPAMAVGRWGIQIGAFTDPGQARRMAESVRSLAPHELGGAQAALGATTPFGGRVLYRARLLGLSAAQAGAACHALTAQAQACVTVAPGA